MSKTKFECIPYIQDSDIGEIEVSIELTDDEIKQIRSMPKEEYEKFIRQKASVKITDFDVDYHVMPIEEWDVCNGQD